MKKLGRLLSHSRDLRSGRLNRRNLIVLTRRGGRGAPADGILSLADDSPVEDHHKPQISVLESRLLL